MTQMDTDVSSDAIRILSAPRPYRRPSPAIPACRWARPPWPTPCGRPRDDPQPRGSQVAINRDRFVLSSGHGSMLIYSLLHLFGYGLTIDDLKALPSVRLTRPPAIPSTSHTVGVETTTGPLGQGIANAVGLAMAETHLAAKFNRRGLQRGRPLHLLHPRRRLHDGRHLRRGVLSGRHA